MLALGGSARYSDRAMARFLESTFFFFLLAFAIFASISVAFSEVALGLATFFWLIGFAHPALRRPERWDGIRACAPLVVPLAAWVLCYLVAALFAEDRAGSIAKLSKLVVLVIVPLIAMMVRTPKRLAFVLGALLVGGFVTSLYGFVTLPGRANGRLSGYVAFYMTTAGLLLQLTVVGAAVLAALPKRAELFRVALLAVPVMAVALLLTYTRGAWIGAVAGLTVIFVARFPRLSYIPVVMAILANVVPGPVRDTARSAWDLNHPRNRERLFMYEAGGRIFRDHPVTGIGLTGMKEVYLDYRDPDAWENAVHLHSVPIHLAASMGVVGIVGWFITFGGILIWLVRTFRRRAHAPPVVRAALLGGIAVWAGFFVSGFFEWNLGDVEVITLFWTMIGLAAAASRLESGPD